MTRKDLCIAIATKSPLYLPLYAVRDLHLLPEISLQLLEPRRSFTNGDTWALNAVKNGVADFAIADPTLAAGVGGTIVVGTVINRAAFWAVHKRSQVLTDIKDFLSFSRVFTYPKGMTGSRLASAIRIYLKAQKGRMEIVREKVNEELHALLRYSPPALAITANFVEAMRLEDERDYVMTPVWPLHPNLDAFMLTGVICRQNPDQRVVEDFIYALSYANALIRSRPEKAAGVLLKNFAISIGQATRAVEILNRGRIYPIMPYPERAAWHNARVVTTHRRLPRSIRGGQSIEEQSIAIYPLSVSLLSARSIEDRFLDLPISFGGGVLNYQTTQALKGISRVSLATSRVVGGYYRYQEKHRNRLKNVVKKIQRSALSRDQYFDNFLVCGDSGSGKTFLIEETASQLGKRVRFESFNLAKVEVSEIGDWIRCGGSEIPSLILVDEFDTLSTFKMLFQYLDSKKIDRRPVSIVLVGSGASRIPDFVNLISERERGKDLCSRIPESNRFEIPSSGIEDVILVLVSTISAQMSSIRRIEKLALYYLAVQPSISLRGISSIVAAALRRGTVSGESFEFADLFGRSEAKQRHDFHAEHISAARELEGEYLEVSD